MTNVPPPIGYCALPIELIIAHCKLRIVQSRTVLQESRCPSSLTGNVGAEAPGLGLAPWRCMKEPSERRRRILALHARAIRFSTDINQTYPTGVVSLPSQVVWGQLVRAADGSSNNLVEADAASSHADFLNRMRIALREAKESKTCLVKIRLGPLANASRVEALGLEDEADELCAVYATIVMNTEKKMALEAVCRRQRRRTGH